MQFLSSITLDRNCYCFQTSHCCVIVAKYTFNSNLVKKFVNGLTTITFLHLRVLKSQHVAVIYYYCFLFFHETATHHEKQYLCLDMSSLSHKSMAKYLLMLNSEG